MEWWNAGILVFKRIIRGIGGRPLNYKFLPVTAKNVIILWAPRNCPQEVLKESRAEYGEGIVSTLSRQLEKQRGRISIIYYSVLNLDEPAISTVLI
jgi:hypothetical protein